MRHKRPVIHAIGNTVHKEDVEVAGNFLVLYKAVVMRDGKYFNLYGDKTEYVLGETYKRKKDKERGYFLGPKDFVAKMYYARWAFESKDIAVLKCLVPIPAATFHNHSRYRHFNSVGRKLDPHASHGEIETNKFQPYEDATLEILSGLTDYLDQLKRFKDERPAVPKEREVMRGYKGIDYP